MGKRMGIEAQDQFFLDEMETLSEPEEMPCIIFFHENEKFFAVVCVLFDKNSYLCTHHIK